MSPSPLPPAAMTVADTARHLSIGRTSAFALIRSGDLTSFRVGRKRLITTASIDAFVSKRCAAEHPAADNDRL